MAGCGWLLASACGGASPAGPGRPGGGVVVIDDPGGSFVEHHGAIRALLQQTLDRADRALAVGAVTITVGADPSRRWALIPGWGLGGFTSDGWTVGIVVDPAYRGLGEVLPGRLPPLAAHELHHAVRRRGVGPGDSLLEHLVREGLADHFAIELLGSPVPPWCQAFPEDQTPSYLARALAELDSTTFDFGAWFFGTGPDLPRWTGYTLGFRLVAEHQARTGSSAAQLVHAPAAVFRPR